jgi:hypothetical protein
MTFNNNQSEKEEKLRLASGVFLVMFFGTIFAGLCYIEEEDATPAIIFIFTSIIFLVLTVTAYFKPLISTIIGLALYLIVMGWFYYSFSDSIIFKGRRSGGGHVLGLSVLGLTLIISALKDSLKKKSVKH